MSEANYPRLFTLQEARELIPWLRTQITAIGFEQQQLKSHVMQLNALSPAMRQNGHTPRARNLERSILELSQSLRNKMTEVSRTGVEIKDLEAGIVDFPSRREGRIVLLCWRIDEETVNHWHHVDEGYAGRRRIDE